MVDLGMTIRGPELRTPADFAKAIEMACEFATAAVGAGLYLVANNIMTEAKRIAPLDFGTLSRSGYVALPAWDGGRYGAEMGFGGFAEDYAVRQHEDPKLEHKREPGRLWHYLRDPRDRAELNITDQACAFARKMFGEARTVTNDMMPHLGIGNNPTDPWSASAGGQVRRQKKRAAAAKRRTRRERQRIRRK